MAIPFSLPSDDTTLEQYRTIHQLLLDLTTVLRTLVARNPEWARSAADGSVTAATTANFSATSTNSVVNLSNANNTNYPIVVNPAAPAIPIVASYPVSSLLSPTSQFRLPLSPPNSQPGSPSPFFTSAVPSAFVLPDVVCNTARTLNEMPSLPEMSPSPSPLLQLQQQQIQPVNLAFTPAANAVVAATASNTGNNASESQIGLATSRRLRKRKRVKLSSNRKMWQNNEVKDICICEKRRQHKILKTIHDVKICSCFCSHAATSILATAVMVDHHQHQQQDFGVRSKARYTQPILPTQKSTCVDNYSYSSDKDELQANFRAMRMLTNDCYCMQHLPSDSDYKIPICMHVGEELRKIVECFRNPRKMNGSISCTDGINDIKSSSFLSQFGRTVFTAALLVIGWKLLKQN